jgi:hypothetical protein
MAFMCVSLVELLCQVAMGQVSGLEYMLSSARGFLRPRPVMPGAQY